MIRFVAPPALIPVDTIRVKMIQPVENVLNAPEMHCDFFFRKVATGGTFSIFTAATDFNTQWFASFFSGLRSLGTGDFGFVIFANIVGHIQVTTLSPPTQPAILDRVFTPELRCRIITSASAMPGRKKGWIHPCMAPRDWCTDNKLNFFGVSALNGKLSALMTTWHSQGYVFSPARVSQANDVEDIDFAKVDFKLSRIPHGRTRDPAYNYQYRWHPVA